MLYVVVGTHCTAQRQTFLRRKRLHKDVNLFIKNPQFLLKAVILKYWQKP